jgi:hypothetical protein
MGKLSFFANRIEPFYIYKSTFVPWCNWLTRLTLDQKSLGSSPSGTANLIEDGLWQMEKFKSDYV